MNKRSENQRSNQMAESKDFEVNKQQSIEEMSIRKVGVPVGNNESSKSRFSSTTTSGEGAKTRVAPGLIWTITIIVLLLIVILTVWLLLQQKREVLEISSGDDILKLDELVNLTQDGLCCVPPAVATPTTRWIWLAATDTTYSNDSLPSSVVCNGLTGTNLEACENLVNDSNGDPKPVAHYGITPYYVFSFGQPSSVCNSFTTCPTL